MTNKTQKPQWANIRHYTTYKVEFFILNAVKYEVIRQVRRSVERDVSALVHSIEDQMREMV